MTGCTILHLADLHLDSPLRGLEADPDAPADIIRGATREALVRAVSFAVERSVALVLIAGDLFDGDWTDWRTGQFLVAQLARLVRAGIPVVAIRGNHDAESVITRSLPELDGVYLLRSDKPDTIVFRNLSVAVHGQSFAERDVFENLAQSYPEPTRGLLNIGLLHTAATGRDGHAKYAPCSTEQLKARGYDYWALGHIHQREILSSDPWIVFSGNLQGRHVKEEGSKGGTLITVEDGRIGAVAHVSFDVVRWERLVVDLHGQPDAETAFRAIRTSCAEALTRADGRLLALRVLLTGATAAHAALSKDASETRERVRAELLAAGAQGACWLEGVRIDTRPAADFTLMRSRSDAVGSLIGAIENTTGPEIAGDARLYAVALLEKAASLREGLGPDHPAVLLASGELPEEFLTRARDMLLARLADS